MTYSINREGAIGRGHLQELQEGYSQERTHMSELDIPAVSRLMRPTTDDRAVWRIYWQQSG